MKKVEKIVALTGVVILVLLYVLTLISALFTSRENPYLFKIAVYATIVIPVMMYGYILIYRLMKDKSAKNKQELNDSINNPVSEEAVDDTNEEISDANEEIDNANENVN